MRLWTKFSDDYAYKAVYVPTWQHLRGRAAQGLADGNLQGTLSRVPSAERKARWEKMAAGGFSEQELGEANQRMIDCLQKVEDGLKRGPWLAGRDFSLADIAIIPFVDQSAICVPILWNGGSCRG